MFSLWRCSGAALDFQTLECRVTAVTAPSWMVVNPFVNAPGSFTHMLSAVDIIPVVCDASRRILVWWICLTILPSYYDCLKVIHPNFRDFSSQKDAYRIKELNRKSVFVICKHMFEESAQDLPVVHKQWLDMRINRFRLQYSSLYLQETLFHYQNELVSDPRLQQCF